MSKNNIAKKKSRQAKMRAAARASFLEKCRRRTRKIHKPIINSLTTGGHLNPDELGGAKRSRKGKAHVGQSSVAFDTLADYREAAKLGHSPYGGAEYGITLTPKAAALGEKMARLHGGEGAIICPSGLSAISTTVNAFKPKALLLPENAFFPAPRYSREQMELEPVFYPGAASATEVADILNDILAKYKPEDVMLWLEVPGNATFEIPDIKGIAKLARDARVRTVMDNSYASHLRFKPLEHKIDIAIQSLTKSEGGYGDIALGAVIAGNDKDLAKLQRTLKISGNGAVSPITCELVSHRIDSTEKRLDRHHATALKLMDWFSRQEFVDRILCPALESSPDNGRFQEYFGKGNGLFSVVFKDDIPAEKIEKFMDRFSLFRIAEGWGSHVSLVMQLNPNKRYFSEWPKGAVVRFHAGLENTRDLRRDLKQAAKSAFGSVTSKREFARRNAAMSGQHPGM